MLRGKLVGFDGNRGIVDVAGVGYEVFATRGSLLSWHGDDEIVVHVSTQVREDAIALYGFEDDDARRAFSVLLGVSGVGPKVALAALDTLSPEALATAVDRDDILALAKIPGVGKKTAQRLALELKGKLSLSFVPTRSARTPVRTEQDKLPLALARLGYTKTEIDRARAALEQQGITQETDISERLRAALRVLSGGS